MLKKRQYVLVKSHYYFGELNLICFTRFTKWNEPYMWSGWIGYENKVLLFNDKSNSWMRTGDKQINTDTVCVNVSKETYYMLKTFAKRFLQ